MLQQYQYMNRLCCLFFNRLTTRQQQKSVENGSIEELSYLGLEIPVIVRFTVEGRKYLDRLDEIVHGNETSKRALGEKDEGIFIDGQKKRKSTKKDKDNLNKQKHTVEFRNKRFKHVCKMAAEGRLVCSSDDDHDSLPKTESCSLNPEACELEYLHFNGDKLLWSNDLDSLKNFVVNVLKLQGK